MAALKLEADLYRFASSHKLFQVSNLAYLVVDAARSYLRRKASQAFKPKKIDEEDWLKASYVKMFAFNDEMKPPERKKWALGQYEKYLRLMHAGAQAMGIHSLFLIQPIPGLGKPLTARETEFARKSDSRLYKEMAEHLLALRGKKGVPVYSLLDSFKNEPREIYQDAIHVNKLGNEIMAHRIADLIEKAWGWPRKRTGAQDAAGKINK